MNLQEQISRIQDMMGLNESTYLKRRIDPDRMEKEFDNGLNYMTFNLAKNKDKWNAITLDKFTDVVITVMIDGIHGELSDWGTKDFPYNETHNYLKEIYSDRIKQRYDEIMN